MIKISIRGEHKSTIFTITKIITVVRFIKYFNIGKSMKICIIFSNILEFFLIWQTLEMTQS